MALRKDRLQTFKRELIARRQSLVKDLHATTEQLINDDASFSDSIDQASADSDKSLALQIKNREREVLIQIDAALKRIEEGSFGECEQCGESIVEARMRAYPATTLCIDCKAELEFEQNRFSGKGA